ncbi:MAG: aminopeptidase P, partial [uncultured bacterium]
MKIISEGLFSLGLFKVSLEKVISTGSYSIFYPHGISHMLGLDVHDVFIKPRKKKNTLNLRADIILEENFLITVEPGIYFNKLILT